MTYEVRVQTFRGPRANGIGDTIISRRQVRGASAQKVASREADRLRKTTLAGGTIIRVVGHGDTAEEAL